MNLWPEEPVLFAVFPELRYRRMMGIGRKIIPPLIAFLLLWIYFTCGGFKGIYFLFLYPTAGSMYLYLAVVTVILFIVVLLELPVVGFAWFSKRSRTELNAKQKLFYHELCQELQKEPVQQPTLYDFAATLNTAVKTLKNKDFLERL